MRLLLAATAGLVLSGCTRVLTPAQVSTAGRDELQHAYLKARHAQEHASLVQSWSPWMSPEQYFRAIRHRATELYPWDDQTDELVIGAQLATGMPRDALWWSWGPPWHEDITRYPTGEVRRWRYGGRYSGTDVTIENGTVIWWHTDE